MNKVIKNEENSNLADNAKKFLKGIKTPVLALAIVMSLSGCGKDEQNQNNKNHLNDGTDFTINVQTSFNFDDVNYSKQVDRRIDEIDQSINQNGDVIYTKEEIKEMILFANYYQLNNKPNYNSLKKIQKLAKRIAVCSTFMDSTLFLTTNNIDYELISNYQSFVTKLNDENRSTEQKIKYAKSLNDLTARIFTSNYDLYRDATASGLQIVASMYNIVGEEVDDLTAGKNWGPIYGDDVEIDGSYGSICVEELRKFMKNLKEDNFVNQVALFEMVYSQEEALELVR